MVHKNKKNKILLNDDLYGMKLTSFLTYSTNKSLLRVALPFFMPDRVLFMMFDMGIDYSKRKYIAHLTNCSLTQCIIQTP